MIVPTKKDTETECRNATEHQQLEKLIATHHGNLSAMQRELAKGGEEITREGVAVRLRAHGLFGAAAAARRVSMVTGPRAQAKGEEYTLERTRILDALATAPTYREARQVLGFTHRTLYRKLKEFNISARTVIRHRARMSKPEPTRDQLAEVLGVIGRKPNLTATEVAAELEIPRWDAIARCKVAAQQGLLEREGKARFRLGSPVSQSAAS